MNIIPGDIVIISDIVFADGSVDHAKGGRPCFVMLVDNEQSKEVSYIPLVTNIWRANLYHEIDQYTIYDNLKNAVLLDLSHVYQTDMEKVIAVVGNVGKDFMRIAKSFRDYHISRTCSSEMQQILMCIDLYEQHQDLITKVLFERQKDMHIAARNRRKMANVIEEEDPITKRLQRKKYNHYRFKKEAAREASF